MNASISATPACSHAAIIASASATLMASGFSHSTCLPAAAAASRPLGVEVVGQRDVHRFDIGVGEQLVVRAVGPWDPQLGRRHLGTERESREAMATTSQRDDRSIAGMTLRVAMDAHPSTPQRTGSNAAHVASRSVAYAPRTSAAAAAPGPGSTTSPSPSRH